MVEGREEGARDEEGTALGRTKTYVRRDSCCTSSGKKWEENKKKKGRKKTFSFLSPHVF